LSVIVNYNGSQYILPTVGETDRGPTVTSYMADLANSAITLTAPATVTNKVLQLQSGTVAAPSLSFTADTSTGLYSPGVGQLAFSTGAAQRLSINATGQVTIPNINADGGTIDGTQIGSITPSTGVFSNLTANGTVAGTGFTNRLASPGPIGNTTASTGAFTTLSASSTVSGAGFTAWAASPPAIGSTTASTGRFTTLTTTSTIAATGAITGASYGGGPISGTTGTYSAGISATTGTYSSSLSATALTATTGNIQSTAGTVLGINLFATTGGVYPASSAVPSYVLFADASNCYTQYTSNWYWAWNRSNGTLTWVGNAAGRFAIDSAGNTTITGVLAVSGQVSGSTFTGPGGVAAVFNGSSSNSGSGFQYGSGGGFGYSGGIGYTAQFNSNTWANGGYFSNSDARTKTNIEEITEQDALDWITKGRPVTFLKDGRRQSGFLAQEDVIAGRGLAINAVPDTDPMFAESDGVADPGVRLIRDYAADNAYLTRALQWCIGEIRRLKEAR
jgi:hypothetical protein